MAHKLVIFISSTADLTAERDAVERVLNNLDIDGERFETWPPTPDTDGGMAECLRQLDEADAVILLLGSQYGSIVDGTLSATHVEYRRAINRKTPVFPFLLHSDTRDLKQAEFVAEVQGSQFRGPAIRAIADLERIVRLALLQEYTRCFKKVHGPPELLKSADSDSVPSPLVRSLSLSEDPSTAREQITALYDEFQEATIQKLAPQIVLRFQDDPQILNYLYMSEVNLGMQGVKVDHSRIEDAIAFWGDPALRKFTTDYSLAFCQGNALGVLKRPHEAIERYKFALSKEPRFAPCWKNLGTAYIDVGDRVSAKRSFETAVTHQPDLFEARYSLASLAIDDEEWQVAIDQLNRIDMKTLPPMQRAWVLGQKARGQSSLGNHEQALHLIESALSTDPDADWPWLTAGRLHAIARRADRRWMQAARAFAERLVSRFPDNADAWAELGHTYWQLRTNEASAKLTRQCRTAFTKALEIGHEDDGLASDRLGHLAMDDGNLSEAERFFRAAAAKDRSQFGYCLGFCLQKEGSYDEALKWLIEATENHQRDALGWGQVGFCYSHLRDFANAATAYRTAIGIDPDYALAHYQLGGVLWNDRQFPAAIVVLTEALSRFPDHECAAQARRMLSS